MLVTFFIFAKRLSSDIPEFIANFLITVVLFRGDNSKALSAFLTDLPKVLAALYDVDEPTVDSFIAALIECLPAFFNYISVVVLCLPFELFHHKKYISLSFF